MLRAGRFDELDTQNVAEELADVGRAQYDKLESALKVILLHMLRWDRRAGTAKAGAGQQHLRAQEAGRAGVAQESRGSSRGWLRLWRKPTRALARLPPRKPVSIEIASRRIAPTIGTR
jgi:hypothetical protein